MDITISFSATPSTSVGPFTVTVRDASNNATQTFTNITRTQLLNGYLIQNITSLDTLIRAESSGTCNTFDTLDISGITGAGGGGGGFTYTSSALMYYGSSRFASCSVNSAPSVNVWYSGNLNALIVGDNVYASSSGDPLQNGYYFTDGLTVGSFYVISGQIQSITDCNGNQP